MQKNTRILAKFEKIEFLYKNSSNFHKKFTARSYKLQFLFISVAKTKKIILKRNQKFPFLP